MTKYADAMISWIVATHDPDLMERMLMRTLVPGFVEGDQIIVQKDATSITRAYAEAQAQATQPIRCYIHHDVEILNLEALRDALIYAAENPKIGMIGVIGSRSVVIPWWNGDPLGGCMDSRLGRLAFAGSGECAILDGLLLATTHEVSWDVSWPGWHGYDYDACLQMSNRNLVNWCIPHGDVLVYHNSDSPLDLQEIDGWQAAAALMTQKWGY